MPAKLTQKQFIEKCRNVHGDRYDYSQLCYSTAHQTVAIICPKHGFFEQKAYHHAVGNGCRKCKYLDTSSYMRNSSADFIKKAQAKHGVGAYDYSQAVYISQKEKIAIICPAHGLFKQSPSRHLCGGGCPQCGQVRRSNAAKRPSWLDKANGRIATLYFVMIFNELELFYKIGVTFLSVEKRFTQKIMNSYQYKILALHRSSNPARVQEWEQSILETFAHLRYRPKLRFNGSTECFSSADEILAIFPL